MHTYLRAIGFSNCKSRHQLEDIYRCTLNTPNRKIMTTISADTSLLQFEKDFGKDFGLSLIGEYDISDSLSIEHYFPYMKGQRIMQFENITIQKQTDKESYAGVCEDYHLGMTIIFYIINIADYAKSKWLNYSNRQLTKVRFSGLSVSGAILLGMHHTKQEIAIEAKGRNRRNTLLNAAREGDMDAMEQLTYDEMNTYTSISSRILREDVLSIIDTSFMPCGVECDHYMVIGNIYAVEKLQNSYSKEIVYNLLIEANGLVINICINEADLQGEPRVGRRFRGEIWLQGVIHI